MSAGTDPRWEEVLRSHLAHRDPGPAPESLRESLAGIAANRPAGGRVSAMLGVAVRALAAAGLVVVIVILLGSRSRPADLRPVDPGGPVPAPELGLHPGDGVSPPGPELTGLTLSSVTFAIALFVWRRPRRWARPAAATLIVVLIAADGWALAAQQLRFGSAQAPGLGYLEVRAGGDFAFSRHIYDGDATGRFSFAFTIRNDSPVEVRLRGLARSVAADLDLRGFGFAALGTATTDFTIDARPDLAVPFRPITIPPGEEAGVTVLGSVGRCSVKPGDVDEVGGWGLGTIPFEYDVLGWTRTIEMILPYQISVSSEPACDRGGPWDPTPEPSIPDVSPSP